MARPIPSNPAGLHPHYHAAVQPFIQTSPASPRPWGRAVVRAARASPVKQGLLVVSALTGGLAILMSLEILPSVTASVLGLGERGAFYLLMAGVYLLVSSCYAAGRTRMLRELNRAPWDARLMAYGNLAVGGAVSVALVMTLLMGMAILALVVAPTALMLRGWREP